MVCGKCTNKQLQNTTNNNRRQETKHCINTNYGGLHPVLLLIDLRPIVATEVLERTDIPGDGGGRGWRLWT